MYFIRTAEVDKRRRHLLHSKARSVKELVRFLPFVCVLCCFFSDGIVCFSVFLFVTCSNQLSQIIFATG